MLEKGGTRVAEVDMNKQVAANFKDIGTTGLNRWGHDVFEEFLPNLRYPRAARVFKEMSSNDPVIGAILYMAEQLVKGCTWRVEPAGEKRADKQAAEFLQECLNDMSNNWTETITEILSYFVYGWSWHEIVYKRRLGADKDPTKRSKYNDGRIGWRRLPGRSQETLNGWSFDPNDDGGILAMEQLGAPDYQLHVIPIEKSLLFRTRTERNNPEGRSLLRNAYRPWYFKKHIEEIEGIGIERDLAGLPVLKTPEGVDVWNPNDSRAVQILNRAQTIVRNIRRDKNEGIVLPFGWDLSLLSSGGKKSFDTNAVLNRYDQRIAITLLADIVMLGADKVGSFALADVKKGLLSAALQAQVNNIADVFNRYAVPRLFALNTFTGLTDYPKLCPSDIESVDLKEIADYIQKLSGCNMPLFPDINLENYLRQIANLPPIDEDNPIREPKEASPNDSGSKEDNKDGTDDTQQQEEQESNTEQE